MGEKKFGKFVIQTITFFPSIVNPLSLVDVQSAIGKMFFLFIRSLKSQFAASSLASLSLSLSIQGFSLLLLRCRLCIYWEQRDVTDFAMSLRKMSLIIVNCNY